MRGRSGIELLEAADVRHGHLEVDVVDRDGHAVQGDRCAADDLEGDAGSLQSSGEGAQDGTPKRFEGDGHGGAIDLKNVKKLSEKEMEEALEKIKEKL